MFEWEGTLGCHGDTAAEVNSKLQRFLSIPCSRGAITQIADDGSDDESTELRYESIVAHKLYVIKFSTMKDKSEQSRNTAPELNSRT